MIYFPVQTFRFTASVDSMIGELVGYVDVQCDSGESLSTLTILDNTVPFNISASNLRITVADTLVFNKYTFKIKAVSNIGNEATATVVINVRGGIDPPPPPSIEPSNIGLIFNKFATWGGKVLQFAKASPVDPWNPLNLNPYTIRVEVPNRCEVVTYPGSPLSINQVSTNVYDVTNSSSNWSSGFSGLMVGSPDSPKPSFDANGSNLKILGINSTGVTNMQECFAFALFATGTQLCGTIPLFDTTQLTNVKSMFRNNYYVEGGALALYQQMSTQTNVPSNHSSCFDSCGSQTTTGAAELAQIPSGWK